MVKKRKTAKKKGPHIVKLRVGRKVVPALMPGAYLQILEEEPIRKVEVVGPLVEQTGWQKFIKLFRDAK